MADEPDDVGAIDLRRRVDARLRVSRIAADLFWRDGVAATRGEDIAAAAGIATRTLWRYFRAKEACAEPVLAAIGDEFCRMVEAWPLELSIREFLGAAARSGPVEYTADQVRALRLVHLGRTEPALRSAWLMVCDDVERRCAPIVAARLGLPGDDPDVLRITAAMGGANRALNDSMTADLVERGTRPLAEDVLDALVRAITEASGGRVGPAVTGDDSARPRGTRS